MKDKGQSIQGIDRISEAHLDSAIVWRAEVHKDRHCRCLSGFIDYNAASVRLVHAR